VNTCKYSARQTARRPPQNPGSPSEKCTRRRSERVTGTHGIESSHVGRTGQVVIRHGCLHHTVYIIPSTSHRLHLPLCVYITPSTSHRPHHTVYIIPLALPTRPQPVPVATLRTSHVSRERAAWHSARCVIYIRVYMHM